MKEPDMRTMFFKLPSLSSTLLMRALASVMCYAAVAAMLWSPAQSTAQSDVTQPTDPIQAVSGTDDDGTGGIPAGEAVERAIDNSGQKYLNFSDLGSGFAVQPAIGNTIVTGIRLYTANDAEVRDPASYLLEGGNSLAGPWTTISSGGLALPAGRNPGGTSTPLGTFFQTVTFANTTPYAAYRVTFPTIKNVTAANSMQISEVELLGAQQPATLADFIQMGRTRTGSFAYNGASPGGDSYTIVGGGNDTWDRWDELAFAYHQLSGDFDIKVQVTEIQASGRWSKAGIMVRENLAEDSKRVMQSVSPCGQTLGVPPNDQGACSREFLWRSGIVGDPDAGSENGGNHSLSVGSPNYPNAWIRMVRSGNVFTGYGSDNGVDWTQIASQDSSTWQGGPLPGTVFVGLSVSRHPDSTIQVCRAVFANYSETTSNFSLAADSKGCPDRILISFNRPYGPSALDFQNYVLDTSDIFPGNSVVAVDDKTVAYLMESAMTEGFVYAIHATENVLDANGNAIDPARNAGSFTHAKGFEKRKIHVQHNKIDGAALGFYLESKAYALGQGAWTQGAPPHETGFLEAGLPVFQDPLDANQGAERFSSRVVGVLSPAADMNAVFAMSSDDEGKLYLGSNDQPASKSQIAAEPGWNGNREYAAGANQGSRGNPPANISAPQALVGGNKYYLEMIFSEGGGGNWGSATWDAGSGAPFVNGQSPIQEANFVDSRFAHGFLFYNLGAPQVVAEPQDTTQPVGSPASFTMTLDGTPPYKVTWRRNGAVIAGQTGTTLNIAAVTETDNGATYQATISNPCGDPVTTRTATLTVLLNPRVTSAQSRGNCHAVFINFNKAMQLDGTYSMICSNHADSTITPVTLSNIRHGATTSQIRFDVSPDLIPDTQTYYITITGAHAQDGLIIEPDPTIVSFIHGAEYPQFSVLIRQFNDVGNGNLAAFLSAPKVVNNQPDVVYRNATGFFETPSNIRENYGSIVSGYYVAPVTGNYQFWMSSDDAGATYLSTDANPASKVQIASEPAWGGIRGFADAGHDANDNRGVPPIYSGSNPNGNGSVPIALTMGQIVYLEGVFTEGGGGDNYAATVVIDAPDPNVPPANGTLPIPQSAFVPKRSSPDGTVFSTLCDVLCNPGPTDKTVFIGQSATFTAGPDGTPPYSLQWKRNGVVIPGATSTSYTTPPATQAQDGDTFTFVVSNEFSTNECSATLIVRDEPLVVRCETRNDPLHVYVTYNKPVQLDGTYTIIDNFDTFPIDVLGVAYGSSQSEVVLTTSGLPPEHSFTMTITGVHDQEAMPVGGNLIVPDPTICTFGQGPGRFCVDFNDNMIPTGSRATGTAAPTAEDGVLKLTRNGVTSQQNFWTIDLAPQTLKCLEARWDSLLNGPIGNAADGYSFNVGNNLGFPVAAEEGGNNGLSVTVDTFDNGGAETGIEVRWNGARLAFTPTGAGHGPAQLMRNVFVPAAVSVTASGFVTFNYDTFTVSAQIPNFAGINANQYVFAARTGGSAEDAWIDNVCINDYTLGDITVAIAPIDPAVPECTSVTFTSTVTGSPCHFYQWKKNGVNIPGATGKTYTTPTLLLADDGAVYSLTVNNEFSTATASSTIDIVPDNTAPTIVSVGALNSTSVGISFSEPVEAVSATTVANYSINGGAAGAGIAAAALRPDGRSVALTLSTPLAPCVSFSVGATGVLDACPARNAAPTTGTGTIIGLTSTSIGTPGDPASAGSAVSLADDSVEIIAGGSDIWGTADHGHFAYAPVTGDFDVRVRVTHLEVVNTWSKAGLDARISLDAASPHAMSVFTPFGTPQDGSGPGANGIDAGARLTPGGNTDPWGGLGAPVLSSGINWTRLVRTGNRIRGLHSSDGATWTQHADTGPVAGLPATLLVGLAATSHNNGAGLEATARFSNFQLSTALSIVRSGSDVIISTADPCAIIEGNSSLGPQPTPWVPLGASPQSVPLGGPMRFFRSVRP